MTSAEVLSDLPFFFGEEEVTNIGASRHLNKFSRGDENLALKSQLLLQMPQTDGF